MSELNVATNHRWRDFVYRSDVPAKVLADRFDWTNEDDHYDGFFNYRGWWYHLSEFERCPPVTQQASDPFNGWDGYHADSYFSGVLIKLSKDGEQYQVGTYTC
jgi:hypothetical protein